MNGEREIFLSTVALGLILFAHLCFALVFVFICILFDFVVPRGEIPLRTLVKERIELY